MKGKSRSEYCWSRWAAASCEEKEALKGYAWATIKDIYSREISFKEKWIAEYEDSREYKKCDEVKEEMTALKYQRRQLEAEVKYVFEAIVFWVKVVLWQRETEVEALILVVQLHQTVHAIRLLFEEPHWRSKYYNECVTEGLGG